MKGIYEFYRDYGRSGSLEGTFIANADDVSKAIGQYIYFGECLGKHSEVSINLAEKDITLKTDNQEFIQMFEDIMGEDWSTGHNPFDHLPEDWDDGGMYDDEPDDLLYENISKD